MKEKALAWHHGKAWLGSLSAACSPSPDYTICLTLLLFSILTLYRKKKKGGKLTILPRQAGGVGVERPSRRKRKYSVCPVPKNKENIFSSSL